MPHDLPAYHMSSICFIKIDLYGLISYLVLAPAPAPADEEAEKRQKVNDDKAREDEERMARIQREVLERRQRSLDGVSVTGSCSCT